MKNCYFRLISCFVSETIKDRTSRKLYAFRLIVPFLMTLNDLTLTQILRARMTLNISEMVEDKDIVTMEY